MAGMSLLRRILCHRTSNRSGDSVLKAWATGRVLTLNQPIPQFEQAREYSRWNRTCRLSQRAADKGHNFRPHRPRGVRKERCEQVARLFKVEHAMTIAHDQILAEVHPGILPPVSRQPGLRRSEDGSG